MPAPIYDDGGSASGGANFAGASGAVDGHRLNNAAAGTGTAFEVTGGLYAIETLATGAGSIALQRLGPDGVTWGSVVTIPTTSNFSTAQLPRGQYRWLTSGFTAIFATISRIPQA